MKYPEFFDLAPSIVLRDPLADFLGAFDGGCIEYRYVDAVKVAGHSCPTVASAYLMTLKALQALYPDTLPERGAVRADFPQEATAGVTGVIANVVSLLTGATRDTGFKGIAGRFDRRNLLFFNEETGGEIRFSRRDTGRAVEVGASLEKIPAQPAMRELMARCIAGTADSDESAEFGRLWQARVRALLLDFRDDPEVIAVRPV